MKCIKTGFNVVINGLMYRGDLYLNGSKYAVRASGPGRSSYDNNYREAVIDGAIVNYDGSTVEVKDYKSIKFDYMFAGEVLSASRGHVIPDQFLGLNQ